MHSRLSDWGDTIAAIATPPGIGAIGVIRISGDKSFDLVQQFFNSKNLKEQPGNTLHVGYLKDGEQILDEVVLSLFKSPHSYTGEDIIEISCHGSPFVQQQILNALIKNGARLARAGEFTQRAFLNKKMDLTKAEAVGDLIASNTRASQNAAIKNMRGGFAKVLHELREELIQFSSLIELELDFSEEDVEFADRQKFLNLVSKISQEINELKNSFALGNVIKNGISVAIVGKPNAGKSTLLNTLLNESRAIVSDIAGTTRDTIEEVINIKGILFRLIDTAGIRDHAQDEIETMGIERSKEKMMKADIVLYLYDVNEMKEKEVAEVVKSIGQFCSNLLVVGNKAEHQIANEPGLLKNHLYISAREKLGIKTVEDMLFKMAGGQALESENLIVTNARHYEALSEIAASLSEVNEALHQNISGDLLSVHLNRCLYYLGSITGEVTNEDRLDYIFSKFCIGK
ncbi:MAG: tRNA uridine-5-carboxymethylaminomethyl(34) synthesis GTPase MnmE [Bacteroidetes bacterium]|nr:tRNA uridine-5-carboxymethylaminomethyl(34) synthesis GTPase MnmE [Bacteroidota bacterium]